MAIKSAVFVKSSSNVEECPAGAFPEFAFIGRSNVGKSSLINLLVNAKNLAQTSVNPGKTKLINHFLINDKWHLVDLPGYGYAGVSKKMRKGWGKMIEIYLKKREPLMCTFVLIDTRIKPQPIDLDFIRWVGKNHLPFVLVFTKTEKMNESKLHKSIKQFEEKMLEEWESMPQYFITSATKRIGKEKILRFIQKIIDGD